MNVRKKFYGGQASKNVADWVIRKSQEEEDEDALVEDENNESAEMTPNITKKKKKKKFANIGSTIGAKNTRAKLLDEIE